jgi:3'-phosphoadenosine 5'-phosphosulfate sulfotransferase (PAPS reductase)/FAD synthetase
MKRLVALSGGKDSTAMALRLQELYPDKDFTFFCTPTGDELPEMDCHWNIVSRLLGKPILRLYHPDYPTIYDLIEHFQALPNFRQRWCTRIMKIETAQIFYERIKPAKIYVGLRADEAKRRGNKAFDTNIEQIFPMQDWGWTIDDVLGYLKSRGVTIPRRTDCAMCFWQRIGEWWMLWDEYPERFRRLADLETRLRHTLMAPGKHKIWPHKLSELAIEFEKGRRPREIARKQGCRMCSL